MRCIHCGKEARDNTVFCMNCGRPVKHEYRSYTCEIYDGVGLFEKLRSLPELFEEAVSSVKDADSFKDMKMPIDFKIPKDIQAFKEIPAFKDLSLLKNSSLLKDITPKTAINFIIVIVVILMPLINNVVFDDSSDSSYVDYDNETLASLQIDSINNMDYELPSEPVVDTLIAGMADNGELGSQDLIRDYLVALYENTIQMANSGEVIYPLDEMLLYYEEVELIKENYDKDADYSAFNELIYINDLWADLIWPIQENSDQYTYMEDSETIDYFLGELNKICSYYFEPTN